MSNEYPDRDESFPIGYGSTDIDTTSDDDARDEEEATEYSDSCAICHSDNCNC